MFAQFNKERGEKNEEKTKEMAEILGENLLLVERIYFESLSTSNLPRDCCFVSESRSANLPKGVDPDADERTLKVTHRKLALKFRK